MSRTVVRTTPTNQQVTRLAGQLGQFSRSPRIRVRMRDIRNTVLTVLIVVDDTLDEDDANPAARTGSRGWRRDGPPLALVSTLLRSRILCNRRRRFSERSCRGNWITHNEASGVLAPASRIPGDSPPGHLGDGPLAVVSTPLSPSLSNATMARCPKSATGVSGHSGVLAVVVAY